MKAALRPGSSSPYNITVASFFVENFGCRATQADGSSLERDLLARGLNRAAGADQAQVVVLNTCTVTASADQDARAAIRRIHRENPAARILVTGCYAQRAPEEVSKLPGVSLVIGNSHKHQLAEIAAPREQDFLPLRELTSSIVVGDIFAHTEVYAAAPVFEFDSGSGKTRPNLKVQDGCNNRCSFCIIPFVRGQSRSLSLDNVIGEMNSLVAAGYREVVLSGINLGRWGRDLPTRSRFADLLQAILERTSIEKLRVSSVEPMDWTSELIELVASSPRIARHAHVPLQSGSDRVLRLMHRKYRPWHYADRIGKIRAAMPTAAIGADVMVGFPGETDADFEQTREFIESLPFTYLHVFTYSSRPTTPSAALPNQVAVNVARERNRVLRELASAKKRNFQQQFLGSSLAVITLGVHDEGNTEALSDNYLKVLLPGKHEPNRWITSTISSIAGDALIAEPLL